MEELSAIQKGNALSNPARDAQPVDETQDEPPLPDELWQMIMSFLAQEDIPRVALVCHRFSILCSLHARRKVVIRDPKYLSESVMMRIAWHQPQYVVLSGAAAFSGELLAHLSALQVLDSLSIDGYVGDTEIVTLAGALPQLRGLDLWHCRAVTDSGLLHLARACCELTSLKLNYCRKLTDLGIAQFSALQHLCTLAVVRCPALSDTGVASLTTLSRLTALDLSECDNITTFGVSHLSNLTSLNLCGCSSITDENVPYLSALHALSSLQLDVTQFVTHSVANAGLSCFER